MGLLETTFSAGLHYFNAAIKQDTEGAAANIREGIKRMETVQRMLNEEIQQARNSKKK